MVLNSWVQRWDRPLCSKVHHEHGWFVVVKGTAKTRKHAMEDVCCLQRKARMEGRCAYVTPSQTVCLHQITEEPGDRSEADDGYAGNQHHGDSKAVCPIEFGAVGDSEHGFGASALITWRTNTHLLYIR